VTDADVTAAKLRHRSDKDQGPGGKLKSLTPNLADRKGKRDYITLLCRVAGLDVKMLHDSTKYAATALGDDTTRKSLHVDFRGNKGLNAEPGDAKLVQFWEDHLKKQFDKHVVVLWGRTSGKAKTTATEVGPHLYGDSSTTGTSQIAELCRKLGTNVVIAGDFEKDKAGRFPECFFIGKFWNILKQDPYKIDAPQKTQIRLFYVLKLLLKPNNRKTVHVGMRSGNLDCYAFAGQNIIYLVAEGFDDRRIQPLTGAKDSRWVQSRPDVTPRVAYRQHLGLVSDFKKVFDQTDLRHLGDNKSRFQLLNASLKEREDDPTQFYPIDPETQLNANIMYREIKAAVKGNPGLDPNGLVRDFLQFKRGFGENYLLELRSKIAGALSAKGEGGEGSKEEIKGTD
jgi:hypothetical protein